MFHGPSQRLRAIVDDTGGSNAYRLPFWERVTAEHPRGGRRYTMHQALNRTLVPRTWLGSHTMTLPRERFGVDESEEIFSIFKGANLSWGREAYIYILYSWIISWKWKVRGIGGGGWHLSKESNGEEA